MRRRPTRLIALCLTALVTVVAAITAVATPAAADGGGATTCHVVCDGQDPNSAGYEDSNGVFRRCTDGRTIYTVYPEFDLGHVELRYSSLCRMAWVRGVGTMRVEGFWGNGAWRDKYFNAYGCCPNVAYSQALNDANQLARACIFNNVLGRWECGRLY